MEDYLLTITALLAHGAEMKMGGETFSWIKKEEKQQVSQFWKIGTPNFENKFLNFGEAGTPILGPSYTNFGKQLPQF